MFFPTRINLLLGIEDRFVAQSAPRSDKYVATIRR
jgi:hypothetical protein